MLRNASTLIVAVVLVALAFALNPSPDRHRAKIKEAMAEHSPITGILGIDKLTAFVSAYHSVGVASYTILNDRLVTVGAFGIVILL